MAITKEQKEEIVKNLTENFEKSKSVVFAKYGSISVNGMKNIRSALLEKNSLFKVAKKTLIKIAAKNAKVKEIPDEVLEGQVGVAFSFEDEVTGPKTILDLKKEFKKLEMIGGVLEGDIVSKSEIEELAKIPPKEVLIAKLLGSMKSPISGFTGVLNGVSRSFVCALAEVQKQKQESTS